ncbi:hypothetical protein Nepgr_031575 [Nepenthes gracilis]|uniref:Pentatricopeptide repeat-containing protein n=1 Tax=Nepenthes gracilis TaxID=150966 RepID=A0AAD3TJ46_NEPGR|nr:hypothetical protein Nepgr_031575 [Nepenthes gracilis]
MRSQKVKPDICTFVNVLSACAHVGALTQGEWVHSYIDKHGIIVEGFLATALVDMYSKCGNIKKALKVFRSSSRRKDVSTWNSVISGLSLHGFGEMAIEFFEKMLADGYKPNEVTFISVLSACSRSGLLNEGHRLFNLMIRVHKIQPTVEHFGCMVDLLGRFGLVEEAEEFLRMIPVQEEPALWESLLASCTNYRNVELAQTVAEKLLELNSRDSAGYVQLSNMYASMGKWRNVSEVRKKMKACGVKKEPGCSLIEIDGVVHEFLAGEGLIS